MMKFMRRFGDLGISGIAARWYDGNSRKHRLNEMRGYAEQPAQQAKGVMFRKVGSKRRMQVTARTGA